MVGNRLRLWSRGSAVLITATGSRTARSLGARFADVVNVKDYGAKGDGVTDDTTAIQAAMTAAGLTGSNVEFPAGTYMVSTLTPVSYVWLVSLGDVEIKKISGAGGTMFASATNGVLYEFGVCGIDIDATDAAVVFDLNSPYACVVRDSRIKGALASSVVLDIGVNTAGDTNPDGNRNAVFNDFRNLLQDGICGTFIRLNGFDVTALITLNTFSNINARDCRVRGIDFAQWCDSNHFSGMTRLQINAINAVGVEHNSAAPTSDRGVYANNFDTLAIDTFGVYAGRVAVKMNCSKNNTIGMFENDPQAEGGAFVVDDTYTSSYDVVHQKAGVNELWHYSKGYYEKGARETLALSSPISIRQAWNAGAVVFNAHEIDVADTASSASSTLASWKVAGVAKFNFFKGGASIQAGDGDVGYAIGAGAAGFGIGRGRSASGFASLDLIGDTTYVAGGFRATRNGGANGATQLTHRGTGELFLEASEAGSVVTKVNGTKKFTADDTGIGFYATAGVAKPTVIGSRAANAALASLLTALASQGLLTDSSS